DLVAWNQAQVGLGTLRRTIRVPIAACDRCYRKKTLGQALFGLVIFLAVVAFPMAFHPAVYIESADQTLKVLPMFGLLGVFLAVLVAGSFSRLFLPIALGSYDLPATLPASRTTWRAAMRARSPEVAKRMKESVLRTGG